jgi:polysaccharide biosynthesis protein PslJ
MQVVLAARPQDGARSWFLIAAASALLAVTIAAGGGTAAAAGVAATTLLASAVAVRRPLVPWERLLALLVLVILFVPIRRYELPIDIGFQLEPYRVLVALIVLAWLASLLVDSRVRLRRTGFELPLGLILVAVFASVLANPGRFGTLESTVVKAITFLLSFMVVLYFVMSVVRTRAIADTLVKTLVAGGAVLAVLAIIEARTGSSPFTSLHTYLPFLEPGPSFETGLDRLGTNRAFGSAEHPIALSAALVMLVPLAIYVVRVSGPVWYGALLALTVGVLSTVSRTGITMLICIGVVFLVLRGRDTRRLWPVLVPLLVVTHLAVPGTLGALKESFLPSGGLIEQQRSSEGSCSSAGRVADLGPTFAEISQKPLLGYGYGTRIVSGPGSNACILDNQWLAHLVEVGMFGFLAWLLLFIGVIRKLGRAAKLDRSPDGWLLVATTASVASYAVGMLTLDALTFVQVTFLLFIILGIGAAMAAISARPRGVVGS